MAMERERESELIYLLKLVIFYIVMLVRLPEGKTSSDPGWTWRYAWEGRPDVNGLVANCIPNGMDQNKCVIHIKTLWYINIDPENHTCLVETNLPTPICRGLC